MGDFRCIVEGAEEGCRAFVEADQHCYYRDVDAEYDCGDGYIIWFCGNRKYLPDIDAIQKWSHQYNVEVKGSYAIEDREPNDPAGWYFHYKDGRYLDSDFNEEEMSYLNIERYEWEE